MDKPWGKKNGDIWLHKKMLRFWPKKRRVKKINKPGSNTYNEYRYTGEFP